jgi:hypothetical protein
MIIDEDRRGALLGSVPERGGVPPRGRALIDDSLELGCLHGRHIDWIDPHSTPSRSSTRTGVMWSLIEA